MPAFQEDVVYLVLLTTQIACFRPGFVDGGNEGQDWMIHTKPSVLCSLEFGVWVVHLFFFCTYYLWRRRAALRQPESQPDIRSLSYHGKRWRERGKFPAQFHTLQGRNSGMNTVARGASLSGIWSRKSHRFERRNSWLECILKLCFFFF